MYTLVKRDRRGKVHIRIGQSGRLLSAHFAMPSMLIPWYADEEVYWKLSPLCGFSLYL